MGIKAKLPFLVLACLAAAFSAGGIVARASGATPVPAVTSNSFVTLAPLSIPIIQRAKVYGFLQMEITLDVPDPDLNKYATAVFPRLRDAYLRNMNVYASNHIRIGRVPDIEGIRQTLQAVTDHTLGRPGARVLFGQIMIQAAY